MPAVTVNNLFVLPRVPRPDPAADEPRPVVHVQAAQSLLEGAGFPVRRPFPAPGLSLRHTDPFLLLDHMGSVEYGPGEAKGAPWHPHRGFETVTYMMDGVMRHRDSNGGGGTIADGATQWMTAGAGILHDETPTEELVIKGGVFHGVQLWVNLPRDKKWTPPRYQDIGADRLVLLATHDGASLIRVIAGDLAGHRGPGITWTPITYAHVSISPGARLHIPWPRAFNAMVYVLAGSGSAGIEARPIEEGELALFGDGDSVVVTAAEHPSSRSRTLEVLVLGGRPIREPIFHWGPFVMNSHEEIVQAFLDYRSGRMGIIPATTVDLTRESRTPSDDAPSS